ncbi:MAG TPA: sigma-54 dependent transcriptional regulator [Longimicrobiales bacterium]|nr:sigma-54 dependent transcriptional regulator [Longimicrobiales bacterium]
MATILVVEDEPGIREFLADALEGEGHAVSTAGDVREALALLQGRGFDLLITDLRMPGALDGMDLVRRVRADIPEMEVVVLTAHGTIETAVEATRLGAFDYLQKPLSGPDEIRLVAGRALERRNLLALRAAVRRESSSGLLPLGYGDPAMAPVIRAVEKVAPTNATVLLLGESGTGKEVAARTIHALSPRAEGPLVVVNCAAVSEHLMESEIFGHEKGAFTGATAARRGRMELADGGTLFLDEIGEMKPELQAKLLRVLQDQTFERVGGTRTLTVDVRWIAATNRNLDAMVRAGQFREDLYHRLAVFPIRLPPLRERPSDILPLAEALLARIAAELGRTRLTLDGGAGERIRSARWPGNIRELANALERAAILAETDRILARDIAPSAATAGQDPAPTKLEEIEREAIRAALVSVAGNRRLAAERLGIGERTLYDKLKRYALD